MFNSNYLKPENINGNVNNSISSYDYTQWSNIEKHIYVKTVPFRMNNKYEHIVKFSTELEKQTYFTTDTIYESKVKFQNKHLSKIRISVPYDSILTANYLYVKLPEYPLIDKLPMEVKDYYYFITDIQHVAENTTELTLELDVWNTFQHHIKLDSILLKRGHYPMKLLSATDYLKNPTDNNIYLAGDENYVMESEDHKNRISYNEMVSLTTNTQWVCFAFSSPIRGDWTEQIAQPDYSQIYRLPTNIYLVGVEASKYQSFLDHIHTNVPQMLSTLTSMFVLDSALIDTSSKADLYGMEVSYILGLNISLYTHTFTKADFNYPTEYSDISKLYTKYFTSLEVSDNKGNIKHLLLENMGATLGIDVKTSADEQALEVLGYIVGYGATGTKSYNIKKFYTTETIDLPKGNWDNYLFKHKIPTFVVYENNYTNYEYTTRRMREYQQRDINNTYSNELSTHDTANYIDTQMAILEETMGGYDLEKVAQLEALSVLKHRTINDLQIANGIDKYDNHIQIANRTLDNKVEYVSTNMGINSINQGTDNILGENGIGGFLGASIDTTLNFGRMVNFENFSEEGLSILKSDNFSQTLNTLSLANDIGGSVNDKYIENYANGGTAHLLSKKGLLNEFADEAIEIQLDITNDKMDTRKNNLINYADTQKLNDDTISSNNKKISEDEIASKLEQSKLLPNISRGYYSGNSVEQGLGMLGYTVKIKTKPISTIVEWGNIFLRYGYFATINIVNPNLTLMPNFTYWQGDINFKKGINNKYNNTISDIFKNGTTIYDSPSKIETFDIFNN